jgi:hypothetical protein
MKTKIKINEIVIDNAETIIKELQKGTNFQLMIYDGTDEYPSVGMWLEHTDINKACTIMFDLTKEQALFFGKSLVALAESI